MRLVFSFLIALFSWSPALSTRYYLSTTGNDDANGTNPNSPWRSLKKLHDSWDLIKPGDSILFQRGDEFAGELTILGSGLQGAEIYIGAYGSGDKPVITGSVEVRNWVQLRENIWITDCPLPPANLFIDRKPQPLGRFPNTGYRTFSNPRRNQTAITDNAQEAKDGHWNHAEVVLKSSRWTIDNLQVSYYRNKVFHFSDSASYPPESGFGYFIQKHLATLDSNGEWFYEANKKKLYLFASPELAINEHVLEISTSEAGLIITNLHDIIVENLSFRNQAGIAMIVNSSTNVLVRSCEAIFSGIDGLRVNSCTNVHVENTRVTDSGNNGVVWANNNNGYFINNSILRTGLKPGRAQSGNGTSIALSISSSRPGKNIIQYNRIDSTGYLGIDFRAGHTLIKNNFITNFCMTKDDGAGIYTWGNTAGDNIIEGNIVVNGMGSAFGTNSKQLFASGYYVDDRSRDIAIRGNTVAYCAQSGIFIHNAQGINISGNTLYDNGFAVFDKERGQLYLRFDAIVARGPGYEVGLDVSKNVFVKTSETVPSIFISEQKKGDLSRPANFSRNEYYSLFADDAIAAIGQQENECESYKIISLEEWQQDKSQDAGSVFKALQDRRSDPLFKNLVANGTMNQGTDGWAVWPAQASLDQVANHIMEGPALRIKLPQGGEEALVYHAGFRLDSKKQYRLSFSAVGRKNSKIEFAPLMAGSPWLALGNYTCFPVDTVPRTYTYYFQPFQDSKEARVNFKCNAMVWIDDVTLHEVEQSDQKPFRLVYNATTHPAKISVDKKFVSLWSSYTPDSFTLSPFSSLILFDKNTSPEGIQP